MLRALKNWGEEKRGLEMSKKKAKGPLDSCDSAQAVATVWRKGSCPVIVGGVELEPSLESESLPTTHS